jgi:nucleoside-diphosphate-sugar epimerase
MVIGNGLLAQTLSAFKETDDVTVFASGVSNSSELNVSAFNRELNLLSLQKNNSSKLIYFSTCSVLDKSAADNQYVKHKINIENFITSNFSNYLIFRLPTLVGKTNNPHTFFNSIKKSIRAAETVKVHKFAWRYLFDADDLIKIIPLLLKTYSTKNGTTNLCYNNATMVENIVLDISAMLNTKPNIEFVNKGEKFLVDNSDFLSAISRENLSIGEDYNLNTIKKYLND